MLTKQDSQQTHYGLQSKSLKRKANDSYGQLSQDRLPLETELDENSVVGKMASLALSNSKKLNDRLTSPVLAHHRRAGRVLGNQDMNSDYKRRNLADDNGGNSANQSHEKIPCISVLDHINNSQRKDRSFRNEEGDTSRRESVTKKRQPSRGIPRPLKENSKDSHPDIIGAHLLRKESQNSATKGNYNTPRRAECVAQQLVGDFTSAQSKLQLTVQSSKLANEVQKMNSSYCKPTKSSNMKRVESSKENNKSIDASRYQKSAEKKVSPERRRFDHDLEERPPSSQAECVNLQISPHAFENSCTPEIQLKPFIGIESPAKDSCFSGGSKFKSIEVQPIPMCFNYVKKTPDQEEPLCQKVQSSKKNKTPVIVKTESPVRPRVLPKERSTGKKILQESINYEGNQNIAAAISETLWLMTQKQEKTYETSDPSMDNSQIEDQSSSKSSLRRKRSQRQSVPKNQRAPVVTVSASTTAPQQRKPSVPKFRKQTPKVLNTIADEIASCENLPTVSVSEYIRNERKAEVKEVISELSPSNPKVIRKRSTSNNSANSLNRSRSRETKKRATPVKAPTPVSKKTSRASSKKLEKKAKTIQRAFRQYKQSQEEKQLLQQMEFIQSCASKIQKCFKRFIFKRNLRAALDRRARVKYQLKHIIQAWRTRRVLNCLGNEVQEFVNCEVSPVKAAIRCRFHFLFQQVLKKKLYLEKNSNQLSKLQQKTALQSQDALRSPASPNWNETQISAANASSFLTNQHVVTMVDSFVGQNTSIQKGDNSFYSGIEHAQAWLQSKRTKPVQQKREVCRSLKEVQHQIQQVIEKANSVERASAEPSINRTNRSHSRSGKKQVPVPKATKQSLTSQSPQRASPFKNEQSKEKAVEKQVAELHKVVKQQPGLKVRSPAKPVQTKAPSPVQRQPSPSNVSKEVKLKEQKVVKHSPKKTGDQPKFSSEKMLQSMLSQAREINSNKANHTRTNSGSTRAQTNRRTETVSQNAGSASRLKSPSKIVKYSPPKPEQLVNTYVEQYHDYLQRREDDVSQTRSDLGLKSSGYKSKISQVRHRVDCWNTAPQAKVEPPQTVSVAPILVTSPARLCTLGSKIVKPSYAAGKSPVVGKLTVKQVVEAREAVILSTNRLSGSRTKSSCNLSQKDNQIPPKTTVSQVNHRLEARQNARQQKSDPREKYETIRESYQASRDSRKVLSDGHPQTSHAYPVGFSNTPKSPNVMKSQVITPSSRSLVQPSHTPKTFESVTLTNKVPVAEPKVELDPRLLSKSCLNFDEQNQVARMTLQEINGLFEQISQVKTETQARKRNQSNEGASGSINSAVLVNQKLTTLKATATQVEKMERQFRRMVRDLETHFDGQKAKLLK